MHAFHDYQKKQLLEKLKRRVVVWYDSRREFEQFISEFLNKELSSIPPGEILNLPQENGSVNFIKFSGSYFEIRFAVEPLVNSYLPEPLLIYAPGKTRQKTLSILMELEEGGECYEPSLRRQARNALKEKGFDDGHIDELLNSEHLTYEDVQKFVDQAGPATVQPSMLQVVYEVSQNDRIVAAWLSKPALDGEIVEKNSIQGLYKLIEARLGFSLDINLPLTDARKKVSRSLLVGEFKADLQCDLPSSLTMIETPQEADKIAFMRLVIQSLRKDFPEEYVALADSVQRELSLDSIGLAADCLGSIDTFRFEEQALLYYCDELIIQGKYTDALKIEEARGSSFWVDRQVDRKGQWQACRMMTKLGALIDSIVSEIKTVGTKPEKWVEAYSQQGGWYRMDQMHRQLEALIANLDDEPVLHRALNTIEYAYDEVVQSMTTGFTKALQESQWQIAGFQHQTETYERSVASLNGSIAYFWVDALRYEMGAELARQLDGTGEILMRPVVAALPSITKVGMAALLPEASASFDVIADKDKLAVRIAGSIMPDLPARRKHLQVRQPQLLELGLYELLQSGSKKLKGKVAAVPLIIVRSQEIDSLGESASDYLARSVMETVIGNVARAVRMLAACGIEHFVITADHGHLFSRVKGDDMKTESPGGNKIELHRRCWIGQGGSMPSGVVKVSGNELGYDSPLDFIFPAGSGVFKAGGSLCYHHGGTSLQEMIIPLLTIRVPQTKSKSISQKKISLSGIPEKLATRTMGITIEMSSGESLDMFDTDPITVRPLLVSDGKQVGRAGMAVHGEFDSATGCVTIKPNAKVMIGMLLSEETESIRVVILDPQTDAILGESGDIEVKLGM